MISCTTLPFQLASGREQDQVLAAFAGVLDSMSGAVQILVQRRRADLSGFTTMVRANATHLPDSALVEAAEAHADFLDELAATHELSHQRVVLVATTTGSARRTGAALLRSAADTADRLAALGIRTHVLDGQAADRVLRTSMAAPGSNLTVPDPGSRFDDGASGTTPAHDETEG